ncbi:hypothetical protein R1flu_011187 [Riccia fluitans]|uniref:Uncharacterized protein n=1 Tax=Riccia fluitans TaxID=41844 RepID=A0ABD1Z799_9MARC
MARKFGKVIWVVEKDLGRPSGCCFRSRDIARPRRDTTIPGTESTEGGHSIPTIGHAGSAEYVTRTHPAISELRALNLQFFQTSHRAISLLRQPLLCSTLTTFCFVLL